MIHNLKAFVDALWNWDCLSGCFPRGIRPTDIDGLVEIRGRFLLIEAKGPGKSVPVGQQYTFKSLVSEGRWTVVVLWGQPQQPVQMAVWPGAPFAADLQAVREVVKRWAEWAESCPPPGARFVWRPAGAPCEPGCGCPLCGEWPVQ